MGLYISGKPVVHPLGFHDLDMSDGRLKGRNTCDVFISIRISINRVQSTKESHHILKHAIILSEIVYSTDVHW